MRSVFYILCSALVIGLAYWAYNENYKTQSAMRELRKIERQISVQKEAIGVLNAEWAYLNRPERLRELVDLKFDVLQLIPLTPSHFGDSEMIRYPIPELILVNDPVQVISITIDGATQ